MYARRQHRALPVLGATLAAMAVSAGPAFAGSDGSDETVPPQPPPQTVPVAPAPVTLSPLEADSGGSGGAGGESAPKHSSKKAPKVTTRPVETRLVAQQTSPQGGVQAGAGGMAEDGPDGILLGLATGALVLIAAGGGLVARGRRGDA
jgi:hypothetical protein